MAPMDYFLWRNIKSKMYVKKYENIGDLKAAIISAFQEVSDGELGWTTGNGLSK